MLIYLKNLFLIIYVFIFLLCIYLFFLYENVTLWDSLSFSSEYFQITNLSIFFLVLTGFLFPICLLIVWERYFTIKNFLIFNCNLLLLELFLIGVFLTIDLLLFYIFFEATLIPMLYFIGFWGTRARKIKAFYYFFFFTFVGSFCLLLAIMLIFLVTGSTNYYECLVLTSKFSIPLQQFIWLLFFISFAIKVPMYPFHIWLPEAHVEAPTIGSIILAGLLLKMGTYGFLKYSLILFPQGLFYFTPLVHCLALIGMIYSSFTILRQIDLKKIVAYSSIAHMNFIVLGLFSFNEIAILGTLLLMIGHGIVSSALFYLVGVLYDRYKTRMIYFYSGLFYTLPRFMFFFFFFNIANFGFPGTSNFIGEFCILTGIFQMDLFLFLCTFISMVSSAVYSVLLINRILFGGVNPVIISVHYDLSPREKYISFIFLLSCVFLGLFPNFFISYFRLDVLLLLQHFLLYDLLL